MCAKSRSLHGDVSGAREILAKARTVLSWKLQQRFEVSFSKYTRSTQSSLKLVGISLEKYRSKDSLGRLRAEAILTEERHGSTCETFHDFSKAQISAISIIYSVEEKDFSLIYLLDCGFNGAVSEKRSHFTPKMSTLPLGRHRL
ncbi:hypothetical protein KIN20_024919 [Parelaphostrongylus tenuis]|uniref:Uncharacterized protein n=1 Tax=Parelaphostrongylus tenuis TaxID=148309 RepID=A0AAD5MXM5_PARTN|nr:hypothetical protein KIN20_024919 [Parelaphostrongylus tenuis]